MKAGKNLTQIGAILGRHRSTISCEVSRNTGQRGYRPRQAALLADERAKQSRNAKTVSPEVLRQAFDLVRQQWSPVQVVSKLPVSHGTLYLHLYRDRASGARFGGRCAFREKDESVTAWVAPGAARSLTDGP